MHHTNSFKYKDDHKQKVNRSCGYLVLLTSHTVRIAVKVTDMQET